MAKFYPAIPPVAVSAPIFVPNVGTAAGNEQASACWQALYIVFVVGAAQAVLIALCPCNKAKGSKKCGCGRSAW